MADYSTYFSVQVSLPDAAARTYALELARQATSAFPDSPLPESFPASLVEVIEMWQFEAEAASGDKWEIWLHSLNGGVDAVCVFIQHLLQKFNPQGRVTFEWSHDCSKPRVDAYGGGAALITAKTIKTMSTDAWLHKQVAKADARNLKPQTERNQVSHFTTIKTQIKDIEALRGACKEMGLTVLEQSEARGYASNKIAGDYVIQLKGPYDVALQRQSDGAYGITSDLWQGHVESEVGKGYGKLLQLYAVHKATMEARKKGLGVLRRQKQDGSIKLVLLGAV
jgi:hypothetical protein